MFTYFNNMHTNLIIAKMKKKTLKINKYYKKFVYHKINLSLINLLQSNKGLKLTWEKSKIILTFQIEKGLCLPLESAFNILALTRALNNDH